MKLPARTLPNHLPLVYNAADMNRFTGLRWAVVLGSLVLSPAARQVLSAEFANVDHLHLYVSVHGDDRWTGRRPAADPAPDGNSKATDGPFATLARARNVIRQFRSEQRFTGPVTVMVLEGTYYLDQPLELSGQDSGTAESPFTITAFPGHRPVISGGRKIEGWQPSRDGIVQVVLPDVKVGQWQFRQLFHNGRRQVRARWPNFNPADPLYGGWAFIDASQPDVNSFRYSTIPDSQPRRWSKPSQAEINIFPWYCWVNDILPVAQADADEHTIALGHGPHHDWMPLLAGNRFIVENVFEELDQPGEWCTDRESGRLSFWPPAGDVATAEVIAPRLEDLIHLTGNAKQPVRHITISGLTFSHTNSPFPEQQHESHHSPTLSGAAVRLEHADDCRIENNRFHNLGGDGVRLHGPDARNRITDNEFSEVGGSGVSLASHQPGNAETWQDKEVLRSNARLYPRLVRNVISNNHIHHCGVMKKNCAGVQFYGINSVDNVISHNLIHHMSDKGMTMQDGFGRFIIEYNEMHTLGLEIADTGGIMTNRWFVLDDDPDLAQGNVIRFNLIRDCIGCGAYAEQRSPKGEGDSVRSGSRIWSPYYTWGIYFDNSGENITVFGNIVASTVLGGVSMPVGSPRNNRVENNIFIGSSGNQFDLRMGGAANNNRFVRNIVCYSNPDAMLLAAQPAAKQHLAECDDNVYFAAAGQELRVRGIGSFADWRALGFDRRTLLADPLFVNLEKGDYRLRPESPAFQLGFQPIDTEKIGLKK